MTFEVRIRVVVVGVVFVIKSGGVSEWKKYIEYKGEIEVWL